MLNLYSVQLHLSYSASLFTSGSKDDEVERTLLREQDVINAEHQRPSGQEKLDFD